jgi:hypothetical protein
MYVQYAQYLGDRSSCGQCRSIWARLVSDFVRCTQNRLAYKTTSKGPCDMFACQWLNAKMCFCSLIQEIVNQLSLLSLLLPGGLGMGLEPYHLMEHPDRTASYKTPSWTTARMIMMKKHKVSAHYSTLNCFMCCVMPFSSLALSWDELDFTQALSGCLGLNPGP